MYHTQAHELQSAADHVDEVMRGIGIHYLISDDRKLPKQNRPKWETDLSKYIDFEALNEGMRQRIKNAVAASDPAAMDHETTEQLAEKAVIFLIPRQLADYTRAYLKKKHELGVVSACETETKAAEGDYTLCVKSIDDHEQHMVFVDEAGQEMIQLEFKHQDRWQLVNISDKTLMTVAMWK